MLPESFLMEMRALLGDEFAAFEQSLSGEAVQALRINALRGNAYESALEYLGEKVPWEEGGYYVKPGTQPGKSLEHVAGAFYLQDASAMAPVNALDPRPGETVLDLCAAPGGKSCQILSRLKGQGTLVSNEYVRSRVQILRGNLERMGAVNAVVTNSPADAFKALGEKFDAVLVDAPCSGEGMFRRGAGADEQWKDDAPERCAARQAEILDCAALCVKGGGRLVYSTCTFNRTENERTVESFLTRHPGFELADFELEGVGRSVNGCLRLWPHKIRGEGHFVCLLRKTGKRNDDKPLLRKLDQRAAALAEQLKQMCLKCLPEGEPFLRGDELYLRPALPFELKGVNVLSGGLLISCVNKRSLEPAHALAMSLTPSEALRQIHLTREKAALFMQGEALPIESEKGWTLACYKNMPLGWMKSDGSALKNHLPKGLRLRGGHALAV